MLPKPLISYLNRRLESYESLQVNNFDVLINQISGNFSEGIYEINGCGFIIPCEDTYMNTLIEDANMGYKLVLLVDLPERRTDNVIRCLVPEELYNRDNLKNVFNTCIRFDAFRKIYFSHTVVSTGQKHSGKWPIMIISAYEVINPIKLRLLSRKETLDASEIRNEALFKNLDEDVNPYLKLATLNTLFLAPKIDFKNGIESYSLIEKYNFKYYVNLDNYNSLLKMMVPPEISNNHIDSYSPDSLDYVPKEYGNNVQIHLGYPASYYNYDAILRPAQIENSLEQTRITGNGEIGINHQTSFSAFSDKKTVLDKIRKTEFYFLQQNFPLYSITALNKPKKLILDNQEILYLDYANRLNISLERKPISVSAQKKIKDIVKLNLELLGYKTKDTGDQFFNNRVIEMMSNLNRVRTTLQRSNSIPESNLESTYLDSAETSLMDITQTSAFNRLADRNINQKKVNLLRNDTTKMQIVNILELKGGISSEEEIVGVLIKEGFEIKDILKRILDLQKIGLIFKLNNRIHLVKDYI